MDYPIRLSDQLKAHLRSLRKQRGLTQAELGKRLTEAVEVATIGIGAGPDVDAQVLVITDLLGLTADPTPRFVKRYADLRAVITEAAGRFAKDVAEGHYPAPEHQYH